MSEVAIVAARRTPIGTAGHSLADRTAADLAAVVLPAVTSDTGLRPDEIADVVLGNCTGPGGDLARYAALQAGFPVSLPGLTVDRQCGSGLAAIGVGAALVQAEINGDRAVLAGGVESASTSPRPGRAAFAPAELGDPEMGAAADAVALATGISRAAQDAYALRSHQLAVTTAARGGFESELVPVGNVSADERPRSGMTAQRLARMRPIFTADGTATAGNSCGISDGAAAVVLLPEAERRRRQLPGLRILATATAGISPRVPGLGLVPATQQVLRTSGLSLDEVDVIEFNEAFAGQLLACCAQLDLDSDRVCVEGGAIALGHPWGASGAVLVVRLFSQLVRRGASHRSGRIGLAAISVGGGQGVAMMVESC